MEYIEINLAVEDCNALQIASAISETLIRFTGIVKTVNMDVNASEHHCDDDDGDDD